LAVLKVVASWSIENRSVATSAAVRNKIADHVLRRAFATAAASANGDAADFPSLLGAGRKLTNKVAVVGTDLVTYAEDTAQELQITRADQDAFATRSLHLALVDRADEIAPILIPGRKPVTIAHDEQPRRADAAKIPTLRPAFREGGTVTAANSSSISDGAAALLVGRISEAELLGITPLARIVAHAGHAQAPAQFTTAPIAATRKVLEKAGWTLDQVDLFEINEAFAVVALACARGLGVPMDKLNVRGGACALGHPIGASGARIVVTLLAALRERGLRRGVASICIGGGEATALAIELL
jgi:acetyl-CoA C-acetyltransferase